MRNIRYVQGDLFTAPTSLAHCVSADFYMGAGIAKEFKNRFGRQEQLIRSKCPVGFTVGFDTENLVFDRFGQETHQTIYCLVTKHKYFQKPKLNHVWASLISMRKMMEYCCVNEVSMPKIGAGLDQLPWERVEKCILNVFKGSEIRINIYTLQ